MTHKDDLSFEWPLPPGEVAAIAVSGGADSFALLHRAWKAGHPIVALTVDHGLREGSPAEAQAVRTWCSERNIPHETLVWQGEKPKTGVQAMAREARYRLLIEACYRLRVEHLLTAHNADDQAETVFMRLRRGAGRGLAGMRPQRMVAAGPGEPITLYRPLLHMRRATLRAYAEGHALPFTDDPSNEDETYERVRVRALLAALEQQDLLTVDALCRTAERIDSQGADSGMSIDDDAHFHGVQFSKDGAIEFWKGFGLGAKGREERLTALAINAIGAHPADRSDREVFGPARRETRVVAGVCLVGTGEEMVAFREPAALLGRADGTPGFDPVPVAPGSRHLYDRRFIVEVPGDVAPDTVLRPLGQLLPRDIATSTVARQRIATLPVLANGYQLTHLPESAADAVTSALDGWKQRDSFLRSVCACVPARSLLAERFAGDVIRY